MKKKYILTLCICFICFSGQLFAIGSGEKEIQSFNEMLKSHPDFVSIETYRSNRDVFSGSNDAFISVKLTNNRKISFQYIEKNGGGKYANVAKIDGYNFLGYAKDNKNKYSSGAFFIDLSYILDKEISTIIDAIDNYDLILRYARKITEEEILLGTEQMKLFHYSWDKSVINAYYGYSNNENIRESKIFTATIFGPWDSEWTEYLPADFWTDKQL